MSDLAHRHPPQATEPRPFLGAPSSLCWDAEGEKCPTACAGGAVVVCAGHRRHPSLYHSPSPRPAAGRRNSGVNTDELPQQHRTEQAAHTCHVSE